MSKHNSNRYALHIDKLHISALLEALRDYQALVENENDEEAKFTAANLVRRAELLEELCNTGTDYYQAKAAYNAFCRYGDRPSTDNQ